jgi:hypothetical protein
MRLVDNAGCASVEPQFPVGLPVTDLFCGASMLSGRRPQTELGARGELRRWTAAREYWDQAAGYLQLARFAADPGIRDRYLKVAQHYRTAAEAEERAALQTTQERQKAQERRKA